MDVDAKKSYNYETLAIHQPSQYVINVEINRPDFKNAMNKTFWREFLACFKQIKEDKECRVVIVSGAGNHFSSGLDIIDMQEITTLITSELDVARKAKFLQTVIASFQKAFNAIDKCNKPVIAAIHGACIGGGIDLISACDVRYCSQNAWFCVKEVDLGLAADVGTLQRLPRIVGNNSLVRELVYTARRMKADEAKDVGLVSKVFQTPKDLFDGALETAKIIAAKSPVAVQGSKINLDYSRDHSISNGLKFMTCWSMAMLQSEDIATAAGAILNASGDPPTYSKL